MNTDHRDHALYVDLLSASGEQHHQIRDHQDDALPAHSH